MDEMRTDSGDEENGRTGVSRDAGDDRSVADRAGHARDGAAAGSSQGDALRPLFGQDPDAAGGHLAPDGGTTIAGPPDRTDVGPLHGGQQDGATGGSDLGPTTGGGDG